jgi:virulence-associated protein VagC
MNAPVKTVEVVATDRGQTVVLPDEFRFQTDRVSVRRAGDAVILEPVRPAQWPPGFFLAIGIIDPAFARPDQGNLPPAPAF